MIRPRAPLHASNTHLPDHCGGGVDWSDALCRQADPEIFYPGEGHADHADAAKAICRRCTLRNVCLERALETKERFGVWGATTPKEREAILKKRKRRKAS